MTYLGGTKEPTGFRQDDIAGADPNGIPGLDPNGTPPHWAGQWEVDSNGNVTANGRVYLVVIDGATRKYIPVGGPGIIGTMGRYYAAPLSVAPATNGPVALDVGPRQMVARMLLEGHGTSRPADGLLYPGTYVLGATPLTIPSGIGLKVVSQTPGDEADFSATPAPVVLVGDVIVETTDTGGCTLAGIQVRGTLTYQGAGDGGCVLQDVFVFSSGVDAVTNNNRVSAAGLVARNCQFECDFATMGRAFVAKPGSSSTLNDVRFVSSTVAVRAEGDGVAGAVVFLSAGNVLGDVETAAAAGHQISIYCVGVTFTGQIRAGAGTLQGWYLTRFSGNTGPVTIGTGQVYFSGSALDAQFAGTGTPGTTQVGVATLVSTVFSPRDWAQQRITVSGTPISHDVDYVTVTLANGENFVLPATASYPDGRPIHVKLTTGAGITVNATPNVADKIDFGVVGALQAIAPDAARGASRTYVNDRTQLTWWTF